MSNLLQFKPSVQSAIQKTLMTSVLFEGFWDRWIAHGLEREEVLHFRGQLRTLELWIEVMQSLAEKHKVQASALLSCGLETEAEYEFRLSGLHYYLIQWIFPETDDNKRKWFACCKMMFNQADAAAKDEIRQVVLQLNGKGCFGRIRVPAHPVGCVVFVNPIDSSKEELFTYEIDFAKKGFVTVSFDGPGQGETYVVNRHKATEQRWNLFVKGIVDFAATQYPDLPIFLFGTSSGGTWAIQGSLHPKVCKAVSVSPALSNDVKMPDYFMERLAYILDDFDNSLLPQLEGFERFSPILLVHGKKDVMVRDGDIYELYNKLPNGKRFVEYEEEGHCCNFKLDEIRNIAAKWYLED